MRFPHEGALRVHHHLRPSVIPRLPHLLLLLALQLCLLIQNLGFRGAAQVGKQFQQAVRLAMPARSRRHQVMPGIPQSLDGVVVYRMARIALPRQRRCQVIPVGIHPRDGLVVYRMAQVR